MNSLTAIIVLATLLTQVGRIAHLIPASVQQYAGFSVTAPVTLTTDGPKSGTTNFGKPYTATTYQGELNSENYRVSVATYGFPVDIDDLEKSTEGFRKAIDGTVLHQEKVIVSGRPAIASTISKTDSDGKDLRLAILITFRGSNLFIFSVGSYTGPDQDASRFLNTASVQ